MSRRSESSGTARDSAPSCSTDSADASIASSASWTVTPVQLDAALEKHHASPPVLNACASVSLFNCKNVKESWNKARHAA